MAAHVYIESAETVYVAKSSSASNRSAKNRPARLLSACDDCVTLQIYNEERRRFTVVRNQPRKIVEKVASDIEKLLAKKRKALDVSIL